MSANGTPARPEGSTRARWVFVGFLAIAAYLALSEHRAHLAQALPWLVLLVCPLMHVFMHRGHGAHRGGSADES